MLNVQVVCTRKSLTKKLKFYFSKTISDFEEVKEILIDPTT
jgi:hypothetical protein